MKKRLSVGALMGSALGAGAAVLFMRLLYHWRLSWGWEVCLHMGLSFALIFLGSAAGMVLALRLDRKFRVKLPKRWIATALLAAVLLFCLGFGGQTVISIGTETVLEHVDVDMVMMLDASGSMFNMGFVQPRNEAAIQFLEGLDPTTRVQGVAFAANPLNSTDMKLLNDSGKGALKDFILSIDSIGNTDFDAALKFAMESMEGSARTDSVKTVVMLTDGMITDGAIPPSEETCKAYRNGDVRLYTVRIVPDSSENGGTLAKLAEETGGFDKVLIPAADGSIDAAQILEAFQEIYREATRKQLRWADTALLWSGEQMPVLKHLFRCLVLVLAAVITDLGLFGRLKGTGLMLDCFLGIGLTVLLALGGGVMSGLLLYGAVIGTAFVTLEYEGGDTLHV